MTYTNDHAGRTAYRTINIGGVDIFYREAGTAGKPTLLLLHGFPSSSHMFRQLFSQLSADFHLIAPDYPGFGYSASPDPATFEYSFDQLANLTEQFIDSLGLTNIVFYMQDYGGPIGFRIAAERPELVKGLIIQNANAYMQGLGPAVQQIGALARANDIAGLDAAVNHMMSYQGIKEQYVCGVNSADAISPDSYTLDHFLMEQPGRKEIQKILFNNYASNFPKYPQWQQYLRNNQPPTLITWGKNDVIFPSSGALAYRQDLPDAEIHLYNGGHFLLEEYGTAIAELIRAFIKKIHHA
ncbi:alpha/beta hydrolase [Mucilaginibacter sp. UR6-1]|uniref:alpha/beta fold hydrolase n=1 Tax=Mucilaginibacter sp. UR6-1 TaxID=1435643 RepID=UPI001E3571B9|nr:alpha/beta hydrolase [Mucilaginibacter sp. UR6-1]MCC8408554.1 alpha/beta hydrolase [Mucilaginibacter sp. UR6-1]